MTIENDYYISAWVVSDAAGGNMGANPMTTESTINYEMCKKTAYVESIDGSMGFLIETETACGSYTTPIPAVSPSKA